MNALNAQQAPLPMTNAAAISGGIGGIGGGGNVLLWRCIVVIVVIVVIVIVIVVVVDDQYNGITGSDTSDKVLIRCQWWQQRPPAQQVETRRSRRRCHRPCPHRRWCLHCQRLSRLPQEQRHGFGVNPEMLLTMAPQPPQAPSSLRSQFNFNSAPLEATGAAGAAAAAAVSDSARAAGPAGLLALRTFRRCISLARGQGTSSNWAIKVWATIVMKRQRWSP